MSFERRAVAPGRVQQSEPEHPRHILGRNRGLDAGAQLGEQGQVVAAPRVARRRERRVQDPLSGLEIGRRACSQGVGHKVAHHIAIGVGPRPLSFTPAQETRVLLPRGAPEFVGPILAV